MGAAFIRVVRCESAVTAIEYALIAGLISMLIVAGVTQIGTKLTAIFSSIASSF